jgi:hypothetical protein
MLLRLTPSEFMNELLLQFGANRGETTTSNSTPITASIRCHGNAFFASRCLAMEYSASIRCRRNVLTEPLSSSGHIRHIIKIHRIVTYIIFKYEIGSLTLGEKHKLGAAEKTL